MPLSLFLSDSFGKEVTTFLLSRETVVCGLHVVVVEDIWELTYAAVPMHMTLILFEQMESFEFVDAVHEFFVSNDNFPVREDLLDDQVLHS